MGRRWQLAKPLVYRSRDNWVYVPEGFGTDLDSVPRVPGVHALAARRATASAVIHDWLYHRGADRAYADRVFLEAMQNEGVDPVMARLIYIAVRLFGGLRYRRLHG